MYANFNPTSKPGVKRKCWFTEDRDSNRNLRKLAMLFVYGVKVCCGNLLVFVQAQYNPFCWL